MLISSTYNSKSSHFERMMTLLDAEMTTILVALVDVSDHGMTPVIHTESLSAVHILRTIQNQTRTTAHNIARVAASFERKPIINLVSAHEEIFGNELADQDAKEPLPKKCQVEGEAKSIQKSRITLALSKGWVVGPI